MQSLLGSISDAVKWSNDNQGVVSITLFLATIIFGWASGIFAGLRRKPKFEIDLLPGPTFCCTFPTGRKKENFDIVRSCFALYVYIANIGSAPSSIANVSLAYHWDLKPFSYQWLVYSVGWFWLDSQVSALTDFQVYIGDNIKVFPFLIQKSFLSGTSAETFLEAGRSTNGVV